MGIDTGQGAFVGSFDDGTVWVGNADEGTVTGVDALTGARRTFRFEHPVQGVAAGSGVLLVTLGPGRTYEDVIAGLDGKVARLFTQLGEARDHRPGASVERAGVLGGVRDLRQAPELPGCRRTGWLEPATGGGGRHARGLTRWPNVHVHGPRRIPVLPAIERASHGGDLPLFDRTRSFTGAGRVLAIRSVLPDRGSRRHRGLERVPRWRSRSHLRTSGRRRHPHDRADRSPRPTSSSVFPSRSSVRFRPTRRSWRAAPVRTPATRTSAPLAVPSAGPYYVADHLERRVHDPEAQPELHRPTAARVRRDRAPRGDRSQRRGGSGGGTGRGTGSFTCSIRSSSPPGRSPRSTEAETPRPKRSPTTPRRAPLTGFLAFNASRPAFSDPDVRRAAALAHRPGAIGGAVRAPSHGPVPPAGLARGRGSGPVRAGRVRPRGGPRPDAWQDRNRRHGRRGGQRPRLGRMAERVRANLAPIGITVEIEELSSRDYVTAVYEDRGAEIDLIGAGRRDLVSGSRRLPVRHVYVPRTPRVASGGSAGKVEALLRADRCGATIGCCEPRRPARHRRGADRRDLVGGGAYLPCAEPRVSGVPPVRLRGGPGRALSEPGVIAGARRSPIRLQG